MTEFPNRTTAHIDVAAVRANFSRVRAVVAPDTAVMAVVKADGYGHGSAIVAPVLERAGADWFGVATVDEGVELRDAGISRPILVLYGIDPSDVGRALDSDLSVAVVDASVVPLIAAAAGDRCLRVHLEVDSGMTRLGVPLGEVKEVAEAIRAAATLELEGFFSHLGNADDVRVPFVEEQIRTFRTAVETLEAAGLRPPLVHLANSVATLTCPATHWDMVRPGVCLYGVTPASVEGDRMRAVMRLESRVWRIWEVAAGRHVGYDQTFVTRRATRIAVLPVGYADGYPRALSNCGKVLIGGVAAPIIGRVCMDVTMVDATDLPEVEVGSAAILWGNSGSAALPVDEVAAACDTISYELLARVGKRVPRKLEEEEG